MLCGIRICHPVLLQLLLELSANTFAKTYDDLALKAVLKWQGISENFWLDLDLSNWLSLVNVELSVYLLSQVLLTMIVNLGQGEFPLVPCLLLPVFQPPEKERVGILGQDLSPSHGHKRSTPLKYLSHDSII